MESWQERTELLIGKEKLKKLSDSHVLIAGLGGVGAIAAEMLCRAGIGCLTIVDPDIVHASNRNRQIPALISTEGKYKVDIVGNRLMDINPNLNLKIVKDYIIDEKIPELLSIATYNYVVDAIDTLSPKVFFIQKCLEMNYQIISSLGAGRKFDPSLIKVSDISETYNCKLAYYLRKRLHKLGIYTGFKVVFSSEEVNEGSMEIIKDEKNKKSIVGTISYMPAVFGCFMASVVIRELIEK
ncbi:MAG: tRNA threonylcarbamoyladenosine dehydratase [Bacteroidetes bacterium]|nr:tRNA threonylcarbamoyladenosine dehydratase [Bacteroidota bacterium]